MAGNDWERIGEEIRDTVQNAVDNGDFAALNQTIMDALDKALGTTMDSVSKGVWRARQGRYQGTITKEGLKQKPRTQAQQRPAGAAAQKPKQTAPVLYDKEPGARTLGLVGAILGGIGGTGFGMVAVSGTLAGIITGFSASLVGGIMLFAIPAAACFGVMGAGLRLSNLETRYKAYLKAIGDKEYIDVRELAAFTGLKEEKVVKDLEKMIKKRWFRQGHFDESKTCFITSDRMYRQYSDLRRQKLEEDAQEEVRRKEAKAREEELAAKYPPEVRRVMEDGDDFIRKIHACNDAIPGEEISKKISRMELIVATIFERVVQNPKSVSGIRKMMDYYLPTTIKLLEAYQELDAQPIEGENIQSSKQEIEATLDTLNTAFEKILDDLFHVTAWDVSTDISVLNTMLAQEGLKEEEWR